MYCQGKVNRRKGEQPLLFRRYMWEYKFQYLLGIILLSISSLLQMVIPQLLERFTDEIQQLTTTPRAILDIAMWIAIIGFAVAFFRSFSRIYMFRLTRILERNIRKSLFAKWEALPSEYFAKKRIGDLMAHAINDLNVIREVGMQALFMAMEAIILIVIGIILMSVNVHFGLTMLVMLPLPALAFLAYKFRTRVKDYSTSVQEAIGQLTSRVQEFCAGIRVVKAYVQEHDELEKFTQDNQHNVAMNRRLIQANSLFTSASIGIVGVSYLLSVVLGGLLIMHETITLGQFVAFNTYLTLLIAPIENLGRVLNTFQRGRAADVRIRAILDEQSTVQDIDGTEELTDVRGEVLIDGLTFTYPGSRESALRDIRLHVPAGSSLAVVGKVGSGKTTLVQLLLRIYNPPEGTVFIDGREIHTIPLRSLRRLIGYVPQEVFLFSTTIAGNIAFDPDPYDIGSVERAARIAQVYDNIVEFPLSFDTSLGERGFTLSGGQRQRISMARALIKQPDVLIFDDSLSAVDTETEKKILRNLQQEMKGRTTLIVSHRVSAVQQADQIIVLDKGSIIECGDHDSLMRLNGIYASMYRAQLEDETLSDDVLLHIEEAVPDKIAQTGKYDLRQSAFNQAGGGEPA